MPGGPFPLPVSFVVVAYDAEARVCDTLSWCRRLAEGGWVVDAVVVNDGSDDGTWQRIVEARGGWPQIGALDLAEHQGFTAAAAEGARRSSRDVVCVVPAGTVLPVGEVRALLQPLRDPEVTSGVLRATADGATEAAVFRGAVAPDLVET